MEKQAENPGCALSGSRYCRLLNLKSCEKCPVGNRISPEAVADGLELYERLLPEGGIARLFLERDCQFCKGREKRRKQGYAILHMAHPELQHLQLWQTGKKTAEIGTMVPVQLGICARCRRTLLAIEYLPMLLTILFGLAALIVVDLPSVHYRLKAVAASLPFLIWLCAVLLGAAIGFLTARRVTAEASRRMWIDVLRHPALREMLQKGWFPIVGRRRIRVMFSKSRLSRGLGTAAEEQTPEEMV